MLPPAAPEQGFITVHGNRDDETKALELRVPGQALNTVTSVLMREGGAWRGGDDKIGDETESAKECQPPPGATRGKAWVLF